LKGVLTIVYTERPRKGHLAKRKGKGHVSATIGGKNKGEGGRVKTNTDKGGWVKKNPRAKEEAEGKGWSVPRHATRVKGGKPHKNGKRSRKTREPVVGGKRGRRGGRQGKRAGEKTVEQGGTIVTKVRLQLRQR